MSLDHRSLYSAILSRARESFILPLRNMHPTLHRPGVSSAPGDLEARVGNYGQGGECSFVSWECHARDRNNMSLRHSGTLGQGFRQEVPQDVV